jgi:hypothetical protein
MIARFAVKDLQLMQLWMAGLIDFSMEKSGYIIAAITA